MVNNVSSEETRLRPPVPYEVGEQCMFYAAQDASMHFRKLPLSVGDRDRFKRRQTRGHELMNFRESDEGYILDAKQLINELKGLDIFPKKIYALPSWQRVFRRFNFVAREDLKFSKGYIHLPAIIFSDRGNEEGHAWFCPSRDQLDDLEKIHEGPDDKTIFAIELEYKPGSSA